jgi:hypothetical protein
MNTSRCTSESATLIFVIKTGIRRLFLCYNTSWIKCLNLFEYEVFPFMLSNLILKFEHVQARMKDKTNMQRDLHLAVSQQSIYNTNFMWIHCHLLSELGAIRFATTLKKISASKAYVFTQQNTIFINLRSDTLNSCYTYLNGVNGIV